MAVDPGFREFVLEQLCVVGPVRSRAMFGGAGIYADDLMFALIAFETLYLKVDAETEPLFAAAGSEPFVYEGKSRPVQMSYWRCPEEAFDDPDVMATWAQRALKAARRVKR